MTPRDLLFVIGARPNFVKIAPICKAIKRISNLPFKIVHTGQHYDHAMSDIFFDELDIPRPDFHLGVGSGGHGQQTGKMMAELETLCIAHPFSAIVVIGDVNSTLAGALVGAKLNIPVAHVEAGLRSYNRSMPEEINRIATDHVSELLFAPTQLAKDNLEKEGLGNRSYFSGDVMYDMALEGLKLAGSRNGTLQQLGWAHKSYYLATLHRPYNVDNPEHLRGIMDGLSNLSEKVLLSTHPRLQRRLEEFGVQPSDNIVLRPPFGYLDFITLLQNATKVITDSGGVQKEAFFVQTPCVTLRPETEWEETVAAGANRLVEHRSAKNIVEAVRSESTPRYQDRPYGDGKASEFIIRTIATQFNL